jgi:hypothetical protein
MTVIIRFTVILALVLQLGVTIVNNSTSISVSVRRLALAEKSTFLHISKNGKNSGCQMAIYMKPRSWARRVVTGMVAGLVERLVFLWPRSILAMGPRLLPVPAAL